MCGISGIVYSDPMRPVDESDIRRMCRSITHRGPDDEGTYLENNVGLGIRRLKVIDLDTGHQPISNEDGTVLIVFNGEIYNYRELRRTLESKGHHFSTRTDTETIIHAYEEYGDDCVSALNGMFAFALWDRRNRRLLLARDRVGVKPLYYFCDDRSFIFGSELKSVLNSGLVPKSIDLQSLDAYLTFEYIPSPQTIFRHIKKLLPGHRMVVQHGKTSLECYWRLQSQPAATKSEADLSAALYDLLKDAVRMRMVTDVPLGAFLSGGIDSSSLVCLMSELSNDPVKTFSIGFDDPSYNELKYAEMVARHFGTDHHELTITPDVVGLVDGLVRFLDEPFADVSIFPTYLVSKLARDYVTVILSGDGGDELFAGYDWYIADKWDRYYQHLPARLREQWIPAFARRLPPASQKKGSVNKIRRFVEGSLASPSLQHFRWALYASEETKRQLYTDDLRSAVDPDRTLAQYKACLGAAPGFDSLWRQQYADICTYLPDDILTKVDRMTMANSLEARTPFLDYRISEFAAGLPGHLRLKGFKTKYLLKRCMAGRLPQDILHRKKEGFSVPMKNWLRKELAPLMQEILSPTKIKERGLFNSVYVDRLMKQHLQGTDNHSHQLWALMVFEIWQNLHNN